MKIAVITMAYNEADNIPIWAKYYSSRVGVEHMYVVDHGSTDESLSLLPIGCNVVRIPRSESFDEHPRRRFVSNLQRALLEYYDAVIYGDCDELIVPDPDAYSSFGDCIARNGPVVAPLGLDIFQARGRENALKSELPITMQRQFCQFSAAFCKPVIVKLPVDWGLGFHSVTAPPHYVDDVFLFHLKSVDVQRSLNRLARTRSMKWSDENVHHGISEHHRSEDDFHMEHFFNSQSRQLDRAEDLEFDFSGDLKRVKAELKETNGYYHAPGFPGRVAIIPQRFVGLF